MSRARLLRTSVVVAAALALTVPAAVAAAPRGQVPATGQQVQPNGPSGDDLAAALAHYTRGDPHVVIAYVEGGVNWHLAGARTLADRVAINWRETPVPCTGRTMRVAGRREACRQVFSHRFADYDLNHDGVVTVADWSHDPRVQDANHNGFLDPEDLVAAFADGVDHDHDGYRSDIAGWNFYRHDDDTATADSTYTHPDDTMAYITRTCPRCRLLPIKAGAESLDFTDELAKAWLYAVQHGARVIVSVTADLGYSSFARQVVDYAHRKGVVIVEASNDFDSTDHQGGMFWPGVIPGNAVVPTEDGEHWTRSDYTSWGTHAMFDAPGVQTTSQATATLGGLVGLLLSWGRQAAARRLIPAQLTGPEAVQLLRAFAEPVTDRNLPWPGAPGKWNLQYGYGIPDLARAMAAVAHGDIPPTAAITSPPWYALVDPTRTRAVPVTGTVAAGRSSSFRWTLQAAVGAQPVPGAFHDIGHGRGRGSYTGRLGRLPVSLVPRSVWSAAYRLSRTKELSTTEQYAVTIRLLVRGPSGGRAEDRRAINVVHDPTWLPGYPRRIPASGESQPAVARLGRGARRAIVFGTSDGTVEALDPATGRELPGWPAHTAKVRLARPVPGIRPGHEPVLAPVAVGRLAPGQAPSVVATSVDGRVYAFDSNGRLRPGWPQPMRTGLRPLPVPRPALPYTRLPAQQALSAPVLVDLAGHRRLDVVQAGWDGYVHAWTPAGQAVPGWPAHVTLPRGTNTPPGYVDVDDHDLVAAPAVAWLQGRGHALDLVVCSQQTQTRGSGLQPAPYAFAFAFNHHGRVLPGWPARLPGLVEDYDSAVQFVLEGCASTVAADVAGTGHDEVAIAPASTPPYLVDGAGRIVSTYGATAPGLAGLGNLTASAGQGSPYGQLADIPVTATSSGAFGRVDGLLRYAQGETGGGSTALALEADSSGLAPTNYASAFAAAGGPALPGFPAPRQGLDLFGGALFARVGSGVDVVEGGDSSAVQAYGPNGDPAAGFPKFTGGWTWFTPVAARLRARGPTDLITLTREGYLIAWATRGRGASAGPWPRWHHDDYNSGNAAGGRAVNR